MQKNKNDVSVVDIVFLVCPFSLFTIQPTVIVTDDAQLLACHWKEALPASSWCMNILKCLFIPLHRQMKIECLFNIFSSKYNRNHLWANIEANQTENKKRNHFITMNNTMWFMWFFSIRFPFLAVVAIVSIPQMLFFF